MTSNPELILQSFGYIYNGTCRCSGYFTKKYRKQKTNIIIKWRVHKQKFKIMDGQVILKEWDSIMNLQQALNELATKNIQA
jgi:hypothetical protein